MRYKNMSEKWSQWNNAQDDRIEQWTRRTPETTNTTVVAVRMD